MIVLVPIRLAGNPNCRTSFSACIRMLCGFTPSSFATSSTDMVSIALHKLVQLFLADTPPPTDLVRLEPTLANPVVYGIDVDMKHIRDLLPTKIFFQQNPPFRIETCGKVCYTVFAYISILPFRPRFVCGVVLFAYLIYHTETHKSSGKCSISMNKVLKCVGVFSFVL